MCGGRAEILVLIDIVGEKRKALPVNLLFIASNHNLVNAERANRGILPLYRMRHLDELATEHAKRMASQQHRFHSNVDDLMSSIIELSPCRKVGENVCRGASIELIHKKMIRSRTNKINMLDRRFSSFGIGVAPDVDGVLYVCQIYKG